MHRTEDKEREAKFKVPLRRAFILGRRAAMVLFCLLSSILYPLVASAAADATTVVVEVSGSVPGLSQAQLSGFLVSKMQQESPSAWHFAAGKAGEQAPPNRVVWSFKTLRKVWGGSSHNGFPAPGHAVTYLRAEAKLYLQGDYQMTMDTHPSVGGENSMDALSDIVHNVSRALFAEKP
jgi:hypothetical protein